MTHHLDPIDPIDITNFKKHLTERVLELRESRLYYKSAQRLVRSSIEVNIGIYELLYGKFPIPDTKDPFFKPKKLDVEDFHVGF